MVIDHIHDKCTAYGLDLRKGMDWPSDIRRAVQQIPSPPLTGDSQAIHQLAQEMPDHWRYLLNLHYVLPKRHFSTGQKIDLMIETFPRVVTCRSAYYDAINHIHVWLSARVSRETIYPDMVGTQRLAG